MHGRVKVKTDVQKAAEKKERRVKQVEQFSLMRSEIDALVEQFTVEPTAEIENELLTKTLPLCAMQPDWTIFWRHRQMAWSSKVTRREDISKLIASLADELHLTYRVLIDQPKSYVTWSHRRFTLRKMVEVDCDQGATFIAKDIKLTEQMLTAQTEKQVEDQGRNFHCWDHRRLLLQMQKDGVNNDAELALTTKLIKSSMSNFSAWHYRSQLLKERITERTVKMELDLIINAVCVDPTDQSIWLYYKWIVSHATSNHVDVLEEHVEVLNDLLDELADVKTERSICLTLVSVHKRLGQVEHIKLILEKLLTSDATRAGYYRHLMSSL